MAMQLHHEFTVPAGVDETWAAFNDIESVAQCFPGATVTSADENGFEGSVKVKLGPIALVYNGTGTFLEKDAAAHSMTIQAKGKDKRGNGTAGADVVATLSEDPEGTKVTVQTDLSITGKPAQFGRGMIQDVSDKLLDQFVACLKTRLGPTAEETPASAEPTGVPAGAGAGDGGASTTADDAPAARASQSAGGGAAGASQSAGGGAAGASQSAGGGAAGASQDDSLDLGATVLPALIKAYGPQLAGGVALLIVLLVIRRMRR